MDLEEKLKKIFGNTAKVKTIAYFYSPNGGNGAAHATHNGFKITNLSGLAKDTGMSQVTARKASHDLVDENFLKEIRIGNSKGITVGEDNESAQALFEFIEKIAENDDNKKER